MQIPENFKRSSLELGLIWVALMSGLFSIVRELVTDYFPSANPKSVFWNVGWVVFFASGLWLLKLRNDKINRLLEALDIGRPRLTVEFLSDKLSGNSNYEMLLRNLGERPATDIRVEEITRGPFQATFPQIQLLRGDDRKELVPIVTKDGETHLVFSRNTQYLMELMSYGTSSSHDEIWVPVVIRFKDGNLLRISKLKIHCIRPSMFVNVGDQEL
jgi:hypothetical protein